MKGSGFKSDLTPPALQRRRSAWLCCRINVPAVDVVAAATTSGSRRFWSTCKACGVEFDSL
jgi:hypothetical protein